jgi:hypothetical protein
LDNHCGLDLIKILNPQHGVTVVDLRSPKKYKIQNKKNVVFVAKKIKISKKLSIAL